jgi:hypothetical protein
MGLTHHYSGSNSVLHRPEFARANAYTMRAAPGTHWLCRHCSSSLLGRNWHNRPRYRAAHTDIDSPSPLYVALVSKQSKVPILHSALPLHCMHALTPSPPLLRSHETELLPEPCSDLVPSRQDTKPPPPFLPTERVPMTAFTDRPLAAPSLPIDLPR